MIDLSNVIALTLGSTPVEQIADSLGNVLWSAAPVVLPNYFYVEDISGSDNILSIVKDGANAPTIEVFKSTDKVNWTSIGTTDTTAITATIPANSKLYLKATTNTWYNNKHNTITVSGHHNVGGNIMSLLYGDNFGGKTTFPATNSSLKRLFYNNYQLKGSNKLELAATTLASDCYDQMFYGCYQMTTAPALPATTLAEWCYKEMFYFCSALTTAPVLPATTLPTGCYAYMFNYCGSLNRIEIYANTKENNSLENWLQNVSATGDFYNLGSVTYTSGASGIPTGWTEHRLYFYVEDVSGSANTLSITNTNSDVYYSTDESNWTLFNGTATIPANGKLYLKANINTWNGRNITASGNHNVGGNIMSLIYGDNFIGETSFPNGSDNNFYGLFNGNTHLISVANLIFPATTLTDNCYAYMFDGCSVLTQVPELPATTLARYCYRGMFKGCTSLTQAPALPATTLEQECYRYMFSNCTSLTTAPALPATTLVIGCYFYMFDGCSNLNSVTTYAQDISAGSCLSNWLNNVAATGDFYNLGGATYTTDSYSGIPTGWTEHNSL